jgi:hypothetical protein
MVYLCKHYYISNWTVTEYFEHFVCADAYVDDQANEDDRSGDNSGTPMKFPAHARRPKPSQKGMQWYTLFGH